VGVSAAAEALEMNVADPSGAKLRCESFPVEVRDVAGARDAAHVHDASDIMGF